jgi:hypothetical protein
MRLYIEGSTVDMGQKRTNNRRAKSNFVRFGPIADKRRCGWIVRYVPLATDAPQQKGSLFDHLVGTGKKRGRDGDA